jgi:IS5 family transposase
VKPSKRMLGDKAYDSAELREELQERNQASHSKSL